MYASAELTALEERKAALRLRIASRRVACATAAAELAKPIALLDRGITLWRRISPLGRWIVVPLGLLAARTAKRGGPAWLRYLPIALRLARTIAANRAKAASGQRAAHADPTEDVPAAS